MKNLYPVLVVTTFFTISLQTNILAQSNGDYRTRASGNWNAANVWQKYNSGSWSNTPTTPTSANGTITISHNITVASNASANNLVLSSNTITINDGNTLAVSGNLTLNGGNLKTTSAFFSTSTSYLTIGGNFAINNSASIFSQSASLSIATLNIDLKGNFSMNNTSSIYANPGTLALASVNFNFNGSSTQVFSKIGGTISDAVNFAVAGGSTVDFSTSVLNGSSGSFTLDAAGKIIVGNTDPIQVGGTKTFDPGADYEFKGSFTGSVGTTARNVLINNSSGSVTLSQPLTITGNLSLQNGELHTTAFNLLTINDNATASGYSNSSFIVGPVLKKGNDDFLFPVGRSGVGLVPIKISNLSLSSDFIAEYRRESPTTILGSLISALGLNHISHCEYWNLNRTGLASADVTLYWSPQNNCNAAAYVTDLSTIVAAHFNGLSWNAFGRDGGTTGTISNGSVTWTGVTSFSPFALGSTSSATNPLPVSLAHEKAFEKNNGVQVEWSNMTEKDIEKYVVERSANGRDFTVLGTHFPQKNNNSRADYTAFDAAPLQGLNYYRIAGTERSGKIIMSPILRVHIDGQNRHLTVYPNPVTNSRFTISMTGVVSGKYTLQLINTSGSKIFTKAIVTPGASISESVELPSAVSPGLYTLMITGNQFQQTALLVIK